MNQPITLCGCSPTPLAHYLKALGVLRLLSEQLPLGALRPRGAWIGETFVLHTTLDRAAVEHFFLHDYRPTPVLAPWNGGSGFYLREKKLDERDSVTGKKLKSGKRSEPTEATRALDRIEGAKASRFSALSKCISLCRNALRELGLDAAPKEESKAALLTFLRSRLPEAFVNALDAGYVVLAQEAKPPPLLGTGFNDGNLDFSNNFLQRVVDLFDLTSGDPAPSSAALLAGSLFAEPTCGLTDNAIGQFFPHAAGGANSTSGFDAKSLVNPWDFIFMLEGALLFGAAAVKRLETAGPGELAYPFSVRPSGFGYASAGETDAAARCELWAPLWERPASLAELRQVLGEGRAQLPSRAARDGFEFTRAVSSLGVDRGLSAFQRYSFAPRNGLAFFATPLDRVPVHRHARATELLDDLDQNNWLDRVRRAGRDDRAPNRVASSVRQMEQAALALLRSSQQAVEEHAAVEAMLLAVADTEAALARSLRWTKEKGLPPVSMLGSLWWENLRHGKDAELDLAAGLAALKQPLLRVHWEPLDLEKPLPAWDENSREVIWRDTVLVETLLTVHQRRIVKADKDASLPTPAYFVSPASIVCFLDGQTDDQHLARLARALSLVQLPPDADRNRNQVSDESYAVSCAKLPALFALPRLALAGKAPPDFDETMPRLTAILRRGASGDGTTATRLAVQRLRGSGFTPALREVPTTGPSVCRALAATLFPLSQPALAALAEHLRPLRTQD
jgi:CRISPR-associated protein Csx17